MSKYKLQESDIYYPDSDIAINKFDIKYKSELNILEEALLQKAFETFVSELNEDTLFDEAYFKSLHERTFSSLYDWAGVYRNMDMQKGDSVFCRGEFIANESQKIFNRLASESYLKDCREMSIDKFASKIADFKCELIAIHPFYELNGRITRLFFDLIAMYNGYKPIDYEDITRKEYIDASIMCVQEADSSNIEDIIRNGLHKL